MDDDTILSTNNDNAYILLLTLGLVVLILLLWIISIYWSPSSSQDIPADTVLDEINLADNQSPADHTVIDNIVIDTSIDTSIDKSTDTSIDKSNNNEMVSDKLDFELIYPQPSDLVIPLNGLDAETPILIYAE